MDQGYVCIAMGSEKGSENTVLEMKGQAQIEQMDNRELGLGNASREEQMARFAEDYLFPELCKLRGIDYKGREIIKNMKDPADGCWKMTPTGRYAFPPPLPGQPAREGTGSNCGAKGKGKGKGKGKSTIGNA